MQASFDLKELRFSADGLLPAIVQDAQSKQVLMLAYVNEDSLARTLETEEAWFWSRSRKELWHKGATSGHRQRVKEIRCDCDADTLLFLVEPLGPACHEGSYSCFSRSLIAPSTFIESSPSDTPGEELASGFGGDRFAIINLLEEVIARRQAERPEGAYTTYLFKEGVDKILKKIGEEAGEVIIAAKNRSPQELRWEVSDLIFHTLVLLREQGVSLDDVLSELARRHR